MPREPAAAPRPAEPAHAAAAGGDKYVVWSSPPGEPPRGAAEERQPGD